MPETTPIAPSAAFCRAIGVVVDAVRQYEYDATARLVRIGSKVREAVSVRYKEQMALNPASSGKTVRADAIQTVRLTLQAEGLGNVDVSAYLKWAALSDLYPALVAEGRNPKGTMPKSVLQPCLTFAIIDLESGEAKWDTVAAVKDAPTWEKEGPAILSAIQQSHTGEGSAAPRMTPENVAEMIEEVRARYTGTGDSKMVSKKKAAEKKAKSVIRALRSALYGTPAKGKTPARPPAVSDSALAAALSEDAKLLRRLAKVIDLATAEEEETPAAAA